MNIIEGEPPSVDLLKASDSDNNIMKISAETIQDQRLELGEVFTLIIEDEKYFGLYKSLSDPKELDWRIVSIIPEKDIMGAIKERQTATLATTLGFVIIGTLIGLLGLSIMTNLFIKHLRLQK